MNNNINNKLNLSKSLYTKGLQCEKALWLKKYSPEVLTPPSPQLQAVFKTGNEVGELACDLFPGGKEVPFKGTSFKEKISLTQKWLDEGVQTIYEATFSFDDILVMVDILHQNENGSFEMYEVKSSTWNEGKSIDDIYKLIHDISIQHYVLSNLGYDVSDTFITLLNTDYVRGSKIDLTGLFSSVKVTDEVLELNRSIPKNIERFRETLKDLKNEPKIDIGYHCHNPYECDAQHYCWSEQRQIPEYSVFDIFPFNKNAKSLQLYREGINAIENIPDNFKLSPTQEIKVDIWKYQKSIVNKEAIKDFVDSLRYPIYHFDFETLNQAIPKFEGLSSYEKYPFQYSIHIEHADGTLEHKEFLAEPDKDPREEIARKITEDIPRDSFVMAYNIGFEKSVIKKLANQFPVYSDHLMSLYDNFVDLQTPFKNRDYLTPDMKGKSGLKTILPILVPEMEKAYKDLDMVHEGGEAMDIYKKLADTKDLEMISRYKSALIEYCKLDTLAMVKILQKLKEI